MQRPDWAPEGIDVTKPNMARAYDYVLGGSHNFAVDREFGKKFVADVPGTRALAQANRAFVQRSVQFMLAAGVRQFLDIGSGIPTLGNVHEVAQHGAAESRVVYVDIDPVAVAHSQQLLAANDTGTVIQEDLRNVSGVLDHPKTKAMFDFSKPIGLLLVAVVHAIGDEDAPYEKLAQYRDRMAPGSVVAITHASGERNYEDMVRAKELTGKTPTPATLRTRSQIEMFFDGFDIVEPGLVWVNEWRPDIPESGENDERMTFYAGVGQKP